MMTLVQAAILATAALSCSYDVRQRRIPNWLTFGSSAIAIGVYALGDGASGIGFSTAGWITGLVLFLPWFVIGGMGGDDVKLIAAFGAWLGPGRTFWAVLYAMLAGGAIALGVVLRERRFWPTMAGVVTMAAARPVLDGTSHDGLDTGPKRTGIAYAIPIAIGVWVALWLH